MIKERVAQAIAVLLVALLAVMLFSSTLFARFLHVASTGNDSNSGSESAPWQTIQHAILEALPGDTIIIAAGIYEEAVQSVRSGHSDAPIVITAIPGELVILDGANVDWSTGISLAHDYIHLEGLEIRDWSSTGIWIDGAGYVILRDCHIHDCVFGIGAVNGAHDFLLERVELWAFDLYGFDASPSGGADCYGGTFIDCVAHSARDEHQNVDGFALGHGGQQGFRFIRCEAFGVYDGFDISARNTTLDACSSHQNGNAGFKIWADDVHLTNCIAFANGICNVELDWDGEPGTTTLRNCTFAAASVYSIWVENSKDRLDMVNCLIASGNNIGLAFEQAIAPNYVGDFNLFHNDNAARAIVVGYSDEFALDDLASGAWTTYSGQDTHSVVAMDIMSVFQAAHDDDYRLIAGSLAIDNGWTDMAPAVDIQGTTRPIGAAVDIGAWEFGNSAD